MAILTTAQASTLLMLAHDCGTRDTFLNGRIGVCIGRCSRSSGARQGRAGLCDLDICSCSKSWVRRMTTAWCCCSDCVALMLLSCSCCCTLFSLCRASVSSCQKRQRKFTRSGHPNRSLLRQCKSVPARVVKGLRHSGCKGRGTRVQP